LQRERKPLWNFKYMPFTFIDQIEYVNPYHKYAKKSHPMYEGPSPSSKPKHLRGAKEVEKFKSTIQSRLKGSNICMD